MTQYFFIISIEWSVANVVNKRTYQGTADVHDGETAETVFEALFKRTCEFYGAPEGSTGINCYYLARNEL